MKSRWKLEELKRKLNSNKIVHLCGQRRTGKTTLFQELNNITKDSEYILIGEDQDTRELIEYINNSVNKIFFLDEITRVNNLEILNYLYDECIRIYNKKIFITSTNSLEIYLIGSSILAGRVETIPIYPMGIDEYVDVILNKKDYNRDDYIKYLENGGFFTEYTGKEQIEFIIESFYHSIINTGNTNFTKEEVRTSIVTILIKLVWEETLGMGESLELIQSRKTSDVQNDVISNEFFNRNYKPINVYTFNKIVDMLISMNIIKTIPPLGGIGGKFIVMNIPIQIYLYNIIIDQFKQLNIDYGQFNINFWGRLFEVIMISSNIANNSYFQYSYRTNKGELDDILVNADAIYLIEYKSNPKYQKLNNENYIFKNLDSLSTFIGNMKIETLYVYPGPTQYSEKLYNNIEFLDFARKGQLKKLIEMNSQEIENKNILEWG